MDPVRFTEVAPAALRKFPSIFKSVFVTIDKSGTPIAADAISSASQICEYLGHSVYPRASLALGPGGCDRLGAAAGGTI
jgi:hypothetical protein